MAVYDKLSVIGVTRKERVSDIQKIGTILPIEGDPGPYSGMTEEVIANDR